MPNVLIVDDHKATVSFLELALTKEGYTVTPTYAGFDALEHLDKNAFDLMILDLLMPDIDGLTLLHRIRASESHRNMPIITLSGRRTQRIIDEVSLAGADAFLPKPVGKNLLLQTIDELLGQAFTNRG